MRMLLALWQTWRYEFFPVARKARLERLPRSQLSGLSRLKALLTLWYQWFFQRRWLHCDHPQLRQTPPQLVNSVVELRGWAVAATRIERVAIVVDGRPWGEAALGLQRRDLRHRFPHISHASREGFYFAFDTRSLADGEHRLTLLATPGGSRKSIALTGSIRVKNEMNALERWQRQTAPTAATLAWTRRQVRHLRWQPVISCCLAPRSANDAKGLEKTLDSLFDQTYSAWQLIIVGDLSKLRRVNDSRVVTIDVHEPLPDKAWRAAVPHATGELIVPVEPGTEFEPQAFFEIVYRFNRNPEIDLAYGDELLMHLNNESQPCFKPGWSPILLESHNYIGRPWAARTKLLQNLPAYETEHDLLRELGRRARQVASISSILVRSPAQSLEPGSVSTRVDPAASKRALITIIAQNRLSDVAPLLESLKATTTFHDYELVHVEDGPSLARRLNQAATSSRGEYLLFLQGTAILNADWIQNLLHFGSRDEIGVVGGQVLDCDDVVIDAGLWLTDDERWIAAIATSPGVRPKLLTVPRECSAVSRACLLTRKTLFEQLDGFDEHLESRLLEADLCLRARQAGYATITTPYVRVRAALVELAALSADALAIYRARWGELHAVGDPFYSPNWSRRRPGLIVNEEPITLTHAPVPVLDREGIRRILAIKLDHVGDVLLALPALRRLRELFPEAEITALVGPQAKALAERECCVDRVLTYEFFPADSSRAHKRLTPGDESEIRTWLRQYRFDLAIDLRREIDSRIFVRLSSARYTVGFANPGEANWLTVALPCEGVHALHPARRHMTQDPLRLVEMVVQAMSEPIAKSVSESLDSARARFMDLIDAAWPERPRLLIGIHPGSGKPIKCWPPESFGRLSAMLARRLGASIVVFAGKDEMALAATVVQHADPATPILSLAGQLSLQELETALAQCDLFIGNDSGPTHLAAEAGIPTLGVYAGTVDPAQWGPYGPNAAAIQRSMLCSPCYHAWARQCPIGVACMRDMHPEQVFEAAVRLLLPHWSKIDSHFFEGVHGSIEQPANYLVEMQNGG